MKKLLFVSLLVSLLPFLSCSKKSDPASETKPLIATVHIPQNFFNPVLGGVISVSDMNGVFLADTYCEGSGTYYLYGKEGSTIPSGIQLTVTRAEPYWHSFRIIIETYTGLSSHEFSLSGSRADTVGSIRPVFINAPQHTDGILVSTSGYSNLTSSLNSIPIPLYRSPDDLYIGYPTSGGFRYKWIPSLQKNNKDTIDLSSLLVPESSTISFPLAMKYFECTVDGYTDLNYNSPYFHTLNEIIEGGTSISSFRVYYPPAVFQGFHTSIMATEEILSSESWFYHVDGQIPAVFKKINAAISGIIPASGGIRISANGSMDAVSGTWEFQNPFQGLVTWTVYGGDTVRTIKLPGISPALNQMFPWLDADSLSFANARLYEMPAVANYQELVDILFSKTNPTSIERLETSVCQSTAVPTKKPKRP